MFEELDAEQERKENKRKAAARKRSKRKEKKRKELAEKTETPHSVVSGLSFSSIEGLKPSHCTTQRDVLHWIASYRQ